jgi:hypothetical protein
MCRLGRVLTLVVMVTGTVLLALAANAYFGLPGLVIATLAGTIITAFALRL